MVEDIDGTALMTSTMMTDTPEYAHDIRFLVCKACSNTGRLLRWSDLGDLRPEVCEYCDGKSKDLRKRKGKDGKKKKGAKERADPMMEKTQGRLW